MRDNRNSHGPNFRFVNFPAIAARVITFGLLVVAYLGAGPVPSAQAGDSATMKCTSSQDRVWVYESLGSFDVTAKLPCGETVEIVSRVKGFVKIHAANGVEGYVPDSVFPGLPPFEDDSNKPVASLSSLAAAAARARAHAAAPPAASATAAPAPEAPALVASNSTPPVTAPAVSARPAAATAASPQSSTPSATVTSANSFHPPAATVSASAAIPPQQPASSPAVAPVEIVLSTAPESNSAPSAAPSDAPTPAKPAPAAARHSPAANSNVVQTSGTTATAKSPVTVARSAKASSTKAKSSQPPSVGSNSHLNTAPIPAPPADATSTKPTESAANLQPSRNVASIHPVAAVVESEDFPDSQPENDSADPACQVFFSAYGITPAQAKWIAQNRKKHFAGVCPAAGPSQVDFVIIFSHDTDFYGTTMPSLVHTDQNGFSDFSPLTMIDTAVIPLSEADKARREYVWVFQMKRGSFDPGKFSPRRRYQFTKSEANSLTASHASSRTVEDAFHFMEEQGPTR